MGVIGCSRLIHGDKQCKQEAAMTASHVSLSLLSQAQAAVLVLLSLDDVADEADVQRN